MAKRINYASMFTQRKDGRYQASYTDAAGRHYLYDRDPEVLYQKLQSAQLPQEEHIPTFREIAESWERTHREEIEQRTWSNYRPHLAEILSRHGEKPISEVGALDVSNHLTFAKAAGYSATVVNTIRSIYRMIFDHAICSGSAQYNPVTSVRLPKGLKKGKRTAPSDDIVKIICQNLDSPFGFFPFFLLCTGLRKSEALALTWDDIDFSSNTISITKSIDYTVGASPKVKPPKTEAGNRTVPILSILLQLLQDQRHLSPAPLLGVILPPVGEGQIPGDPGKKEPQHPGPGRRNGIPGPKVGIADGFLRILVTFQDGIGQAKAVAAIFFIRPRHRLLIPGKV